MQIKNTKKFSFLKYFKKKSRALEVVVLFSSPVASSRCGSGWVVGSACHLRVALPHGPAGLSTRRGPRLDPETGSGG